MVHRQKAYCAALTKDEAIAFIWKNLWDLMLNLKIASFSMTWAHLDKRGEYPPLLSLDGLIDR